MSRIILIIVATLLSACAAQEEIVTKDPEQAIRDFISVQQLMEADKIRNRSDDSWDQLEKHFIIYKTRREAFLVEFVRACHELNDVHVTPDVRHSDSAIRAGFDTFRGCRIKNIYALTEGELAELESLGESPGSRN